MKLEDLGWDVFFQRQLDAAGPGLLPARIIAEYAGCYGVSSGGPEALASITGRLRHGAASSREMPVVGDWVLLEDQPKAARIPIRAVLERKSKFSRKAAEAGGPEQVIAANADVIFVVQGMDNNYSPRRLERFLAAAHESGAKPVVILNKADLCPDAAMQEAQARGLSGGAPVIVLDSVSLAGYGKLKPFLKKGSTLAFIGSSGVGKSTIINNLGAKKQKTAPVRARDSKGRHTTTTRRILLLEGGALLIDTPGMKGFEAWEAAAGTKDAFSDIEQLAAGCRFRDCAHESEPGCAVRIAVEAGALDPARRQRYLKTASEAALKAERAKISAREKRRR